MRSEVITAIELLKSRVSTQIISFLKYLRITTRANYLISALNTNAVIGMFMRGEQQYVAWETWTAYIHYDNNPKETYLMICNNGDLVKPVGFLSVSHTTKYTFHQEWYARNVSIAANVSGFFGGCIPLEALLSSTLDCLYDIKCIELLIDYFPALNQVCMILYYLSNILSLSRLTLSGVTLFCHQNKKIFLWMIIYLICSLKNGQQK